MARQKKIYELFALSLTYLLEGSSMYEWRWTAESTADFGFDTIEDFWEETEDEMIADDLLDTLPRISRDGSIDQHVMKRLHIFLCKLSEKISHAQTQKLAEIKKSRIQGELRYDVQNMRIEVMIMILQELQRSPHPILYQYIQAQMRNAINHCRLPNARRGTLFNIQMAYDVLFQLDDKVVEGMGEWLIDKVDEFTSLAQELQEGGGIENPKETFVLVSDPTAENGTIQKCFTVNTQWLEHLKVSKVGNSRCLRKSEDQFGSQLDETGLQLEWLFGAVVSKPVVIQNQAKRSASLQPYTLENARDALENALRAQKECQLARDSARSVALGILQHRKELQDLLKSYPDMYTVRQEDDEGSEDDREVPDDVLLFMLSRELHLTTAKIIARNSSSARAASDFGAFIDLMKEITSQTNNLDWEKACSQYEPDESFSKRLEERQAEEKVEEQDNHSLLDRTESGMAAVSNEHREKSLSGEKCQCEKQALQAWADWIQLGRDHLKMLYLPDSQSGRKGGGTAKKEDADSPESTETAAALAEVSKQLLSPLPKMAPIQESWRRNLRKVFNKMARPKLLSHKADKELLTELSKEIRAMELLLKNGKASLQLLEKHFENVAFHDLHDELSCVILPLMAERVLRWARDKSKSFASQVEQDLLHEEQARVEEKKQKEAKKTKAKERKLEKRAALKAAGKETMPSEEREEAEEALAEELTAPSLWTQELRTSLMQEEQKAKSEDGDMSWLLGDADELHYEPPTDFLGSQDAFKVVQKRNRRSKEHLSSEGQLRPSTGENECYNPQEAVLGLPIQMPTSQTPSKKLVRPRPPPV